MYEIRLKTILSVGLLFGIIFSSYRTGGPFQKTQPDDTSIQLYALGYEYYPWYEDTDGYSVLRLDSGWYFYADEANHGGLEATPYKVGFVDPDTLNLTMGIEPTETFLDSVLNLYRLEWNPVPVYGNLNFRLIFIDFHNVEHQLEFAKEDIDSMFFSNDFYYHTGNNPGVTAANSDDVFGSFADYWDEVSYGSIAIGIPGDEYPRILNEVTIDDTIIWNRPDTTVDYTSNLDTLRSIAYDWITEYYDEDILDSLLLGIIIPGDVFPQGNQELGAYRFSELYNQTTDAIYHVGIHCHEMGHVLGLPHTDWLNGGFYWNRFCLMSGGGENGPENRGASPAHIYAKGKALLGWLTLNEIEGFENISLYPIENDYESTYYIDLFDSNWNGIDLSDSFIFENRQYLGFDYYLPGGGDDYGSGGDTLGGMLIWHSFEVDTLGAPYGNFIEPTLENLNHHPEDNASEVECTASNFLYDGFPGDESNNERNCFSDDTPRNSHSGMEHTIESYVTVDSITAVLDNGTYHIEANFYIGSPIVVANRHNGNSSSDMNGTLSLDNLTQSDTSWDYDNEPSCDTVLILLDDDYLVQTDQPELNGETHLLWFDRPEMYLLEQELEFSDEDELTAWFDEQEEVKVKTVFPSIIQFHDPWYSYWNSASQEWIQPDSLLLFSEIATFDEINEEYDYDVFLDQNPNFENNLPTYKVYTPSFHADTSAILEFLRWESVAISWEDSLQNTSKLVFLSDTSTVTAIYDTISYNSVLSLSEDLNIPAGAAYEFGSSFRIDVEDGAIITFNGTVNSPIQLLPADTTWGGINIMDTSSIDINYTILKGATTGLDLQSFVSELPDISNNTFFDCGTGIEIGTDAFDDIIIQDNIFQENSTAIDLDFYDTQNPTGMEDELHITYNQFYGNSTINIDVHNCTSNCYEDSANILNDDADFVDKDIDDLTLRWVSPCINAGTPSRPNDPDNTDTDIGAYYFHINLGDMNADADWNVVDVAILQSYILDPDPATPTNTMLDIGDTIQDTTINVLDIVALVECIIDENCDDLGRFTDQQGSANLITYWSQDLNRSDGESIIVSIESDVPVYGLQLDLEFDTAEFGFDNVESTEVTSGFELDYRDYGNGIIRILSYSLEGESIPTGINEVLVLNLNGLQRGSQIEYSVIDAILSDQHGNNLLSTQNSSENYTIPSVFCLHPAYPNPFNPETNIKFDLPKDSAVSLKIYDVMGREVADLINENQTMQAGYHSLIWDASGYSSGIYFVKLVTQGYTKTQKLMLLK